MNWNIAGWQYEWLIAMDWITESKAISIIFILLVLMESGNSFSIWRTAFLKIDSYRSSKNLCILIIWSVKWDFPFQFFLHHCVLNFWYHKDKYIGLIIALAIFIKSWYYNLWKCYVWCIQRIFSGMYVKGAVKKS
jgi:hypothetical protein